EAQRGVIAADVLAPTEPAEPLRSAREGVPEVGIALRDVDDAEAARHVDTARQEFELGAEAEEDRRVRAEAVVLRFDGAEVAVDGIETKKLGARRGMSGEIGMSVLGADVVGEGEAIEILVSRGPRNAEVGNARTGIRFASLSLPRG